MKTFEGTKGEWFVSGGSEIISMPYQDKVAKISGNSYEERAANAQLIAAAPELLEALDHCLHTLNLLDDTIEKIADTQTYFNSTRNSMELAEKALNKALGQ